MPVRRSVRGADGISLLEPPASFTEIAEDVQGIKIVFRTGGPPKRSGRVGLMLLLGGLLEFLTLAGQREELVQHHPDLDIGQLSLA